MKVMFELDEECGAAIALWKTCDVEPVDLIALMEDTSAIHESEGER